MKQHSIDLNLLTVFDVIYTEQNLTRAAEVLHITQPAVSNALARLRLSFADRLFERASGGMLPTPVARRMISRVRRALQLVESCIEPQTQFDPATSDQTLLCSFSGLAEEILLPALVARLQDAAPKMTLRSYHVPRTEQPTELAAGSLDIAVDVAFVNDRDLHHAPLFEDEYVCAVRSEHPQIRRKPTLQQYLDVRHIHLSSRRRGVGDVDTALKTIGYRRTISIRVRGYSAIPRMVNQTDLACTLPRSLAKQWGLKYFALPFTSPPVSIHMYWHKSAAADPTNLWLREQLREALGETNF